MIRQGRFVRVGAGQVALVDDYGNRWAAERVAVVDGGWGYDQDGVARLPRPWVYDDRSNVTVRGDVVLIDYLDDDPRSPVVTGGLRRVGASGGFLDTSFADGAEQIRIQQRMLDPDTGAVRGAVRVQAGPDDGTMTITVLGADEQSVRAVFEIGPAGIVLRAPEITLGKVTPTVADPLVKSGAYLADEAAAAAQEAAILTAAAGVFGLPFDQIAARSVKLAGAVATGASPYLSTVSKTE